MLSVLFTSHSYAQDMRLYNAFAHNDYGNKRPLHDALDHGFANVEADIYLRNNRLLVAHMFPLLKKRGTLEELYLKPLLEYASRNDEDATYPLLLMIDIKSPANKTFIHLNRLLQKYKSILSSYDKHTGAFVTRQVTVVITGNKPRQLLEEQGLRIAFIDGDLLRVVQGKFSKSLYMTASCRYSRLLSWRGKGKIPAEEKKRLYDYVDLAHQQGKKVRLWASPENKAVWRELLLCGVDLINTDKLAELRNFLLSRRPSYAIQKN